MESKKVIVPVDFTPASDQAISQAIQIATKSGFAILLFHVIGNDSRSSGNARIQETEANLESLSLKIREAGVDSSYRIAKGSIFDEIPAFANTTSESLLLIGTHGIRGVKQKLLGADVLKIVRKINIPCLIVQHECVDRKFNPIVLPVGGHEGFRILVEATSWMAGLYDAEVHIYSVVRKGDPEHERIRENTLFAEKSFSEKSIRFKRVREESSIVSVGFAKQTLQYANQNTAGLLAVMSVKSEEHYHVAQADKENMINNEFNIPILLVNGKQLY